MRTCGMIAVEHQRSPRTPGCAGTVAVGTAAEPQQRRAVLLPAWLGTGSACPHCEPLLLVGHGAETAVLQAWVISQNCRLRRKRGEAPLCQRLPQPSHSYFSATAISGQRSFPVKWCREWHVGSGAVSLCEFP